jgi:tRNA (adenine37-N6)-methyltransferase
MALPCPLPVIGVVRSNRHATEDTPVQSGLNRHETAVVEIAEEYEAGLAGLEDFDYAWLLSWLHEARSDGAPAPLTHVPFLLRGQPRPMGIFATRGPRRVTPIGLSLVALHEVSGRRLHFGGVDLVDGTPIVDLKPFVTRFDQPDGHPRCGWFDTVPLLDGVTPSELGPEAVG